MSKNVFEFPKVILSESGGGGDIIGGGTGEGGFSIRPLDYLSWKDSRYCKEYIPDGEITFEDYAEWFNACGFTFEDWKATNNDPRDWDVYHR